MAIPRLFERILDHFYTRQITGFLRWRAATPNAQHGTTFIHLPSLSYQLDEDNRPTTDTTRVGFILCTDITKEQTLREAHIAATQFATNWVAIYKTPTFEIWENTAQVNADTPPVRFGINNALATKLLCFARTCLTHSFLDEAPAITYPESDTELLDLDVALWVNGELRGSIVLTDQLLYPGIHRATVLARTDSRFKPLAQTELPHTTIEISLINRLRLPLPATDWSRDELIPDVTYRIDCVGQTGWYVPAVFNMVPFSGLNHLKQSLLQDKMRLPATRLPHATLTVATTHSCCETSEHAPVLLSGPTPRPTNESSHKLATLAKDSLQFLYTMQEDDGNIRLSYNPLQQRFRPIDWVRLAFTYKALREYTTKTGSAVSAEIATKAKGFLLQHITHTFHPNPMVRVLTSTYLLQSDLATDEERVLTRHLTTSLPQLAYDPITYSQLAKLYLKRGEFTEAEWYTKHVLHDYQNKLKSDQPIDTASYPELMTLLAVLGRELTVQIYTEEAKQIKDWYRTMQLPSGAFRANQHSAFCYTRGTSKILEVLVSDQQTPEETITRSTSWLASMQYTKDTDWYLPQPARQVLHGGFRHDSFNSEAWIDTNAHVVCAFVSIQG